MNALEELAWNYPVTTATLGTFVLLGLVAIGCLGYCLWPMMRQGLHLTGEGS